MRRLGILTAGLKAGSAALLLLAVAGSVGGGRFDTLAAYADTLTADQTAAINTMVQTALANINPSLTGAAREQAVQQALAQVMTNAIQTYGSGAIASVANSAVTAGVPVAQVVAAVLPVASASAGTSTAVADIVLGATQAGGSASDASQAVIVVTTAPNTTYSANDVGAGLGTAAAQLAQSNPNAANQIAAAVSNEGTAGMGSSFSSSVLQNGGSQQLADAGNQNPTVTGGTNNTGGTGNQNGQGSGTGNSTLPPCSNPSCT